MNKTFTHIQSALELAELCADKDNGIYLHEELADKLEASLAANVQQADTAATLQATIDELKAKATAAEAQFKSEIESLNAAHAQALAAKAAECDNAIAALNAAHQTALAELKAQLDTANTKLEASEAEVKELIEAAAVPPTPAPAVAATPAQKSWDNMTLSEKKAYFDRNNHR